MCWFGSMPLGCIRSFGKIWILGAIETKARETLEKDMEQRNSRCGLAVSLAKVYLQMCMGVWFTSLLVVAFSTSFNPFFAFLNPKKTVNLHTPAAFQPPEPGMCCLGFNAHTGHRQTSQGCNFVAFYDKTTVPMWEGEVFFQLWRLWGWLRPASSACGSTNPGWCLYPATSSKANCTVVGSNAHPGSSWDGGRSSLERHIAVEGEIL